jgi:hypothetical protein
LYIGVSEPGPNNMTPLQNWLMGKLQSISDKSSSVNKNFSASTPDGSTVVWEEINFKSTQKFFYPTADKPNNSQDMMGIIWILSRIENGKIVTLAFRYPEGFKDMHGPNFDSDWLKIVAGCVKVGSGG